MIKLVAFDLDGTVVDHENRPNRNTLETIEKLIGDGIQCTSISGRSVSKSQHPFEEYTEFAPSLCVGSYNGALALDRSRDGTRRSLHEQRMPEDAFKEIIDLISSEGMNYIYCNLLLSEKGVEVEDYITPRRDETIDDMTVQTATEFVIEPHLTDRIQEGHYSLPPKILICPGRERREVVYEGLKETFGDRLYIEQTDVDRVEAMHPKVSKARALKAICDATGASLKDSLAIGDGSNDLTMLEAAGVGVLLGNADDRTKLMARNVEHGASFHDNGFAQAIDQFVYGA